LSRLGDWSATQKSRKHPVQIRERFPKPERAEEAPLESPLDRTDRPMNRRDSASNVAVFGLLDRLIARSARIELTTFGAKKTFF
jgi:hypothetical protein